MNCAASLFLPTCRQDGGKQLTKTRCSVKYLDQYSRTTIHTVGSVVHASLRPQPTMLFLTPPHPNEGFSISAGLDQRLAAVGEHFQSRSNTPPTIGLCLFRSAHPPADGGYPNAPRNNNRHQALSDCMGAIYRQRV